VLVSAQLHFSVASCSKFSSIGGCPDRIIAYHVLACGGFSAQLEVIDVDIQSVDRDQITTII
jgi:hypothetical protein